MKSDVSVRSAKSVFIPKFGVPTAVSLADAASAVGAAGNLSMASVHWMNCVETKSAVEMTRSTSPQRNNTSNSGPPWMMDKCGPPRSRPIEVLIAHKLIL